MTRPDIFICGTSTKSVHAFSKQSHIEALLRVVKYIKETAGLGLFMPSRNNSTLISYYDSDCGLIKPRGL